MKLNYFSVERLTHGIKTALACFIGVIITKSLHFHVDQWLIITIIVVMCAQINVGSVVQKSYMRFVGTLTGSIIAALTILYFGEDQIAFAIVISLSAMLFSYIATGPQGYNEAGTLGVVTVVIILISNNPTILTVAERFIEISIGLLVAALVSQFVLPIHARRHLRETQGITIRKLRKFYRAASQPDMARFQKIDEDIAQSLIKQRKLAVESGREPLGEIFNSARFQQILQSEKEILRSISSMHHAFEVSPQIAEISQVKEFNDAICSVLESIANYIEKRKIQKISILIPDINPLKTYVFSQHNQKLAEERVTLDAYLFSAEMLVLELKNLLQLI